MKTLFSIILIFLFISCGGGSKAPVDDDSAAVVPDGDEDVINEEELIDDEEPVEDEEDSDTEPGEDFDLILPERRGHCAEKPCEDVENSTGVCVYEETGYYGYHCECLENYSWSHVKRKCLDSRTAECTGLPEHAVWNIASSITQMTEDGENWFPSTSATWHDPETKCTEDCCFKCAETYFWNGNECVNLCDSEPCKNMPHSTEECFPIGAYNYTCGCDEGYYWWGEKRGCTAEKPAFGNICTGVYKCSNNSEKIECPASGGDFYGQDAQYADAGACAPHDFAINSKFPEEPTVLVRNTNLEWAQKFFEGKTWEEAADFCENLTYAGKSDWRLPTMHEFFSIYDKSESDGYPLHQIYFQGFSFSYSYLWSSDSYDDEKAWTFSNNVMGGSEGTPYLSSKSQKNGVRCVRGEKFQKPVFETLTVNGDKVVTDSATGFMWQKDHVLKGEWKQALNYCENLVYAGYSDWRVPNRNELLSLIDYEAYDPASDFPEIIEKNAASYYFFTSTSPRNSRVSTILSFDGKIVDIGKVESNYHYTRNVRCVRSDVCDEGFFLKDSECVPDPCKEGSCEVANSTGICVPKTETGYECQCLEGYFWNGSKCVNPCEMNPCSEIANSDKNCTAVNSSLYFCGYNEGYGWKSGKCEPFAAGVSTLGNICTGNESVAPAEFSVCKAQDFELKTVSNQEIVVDNNTKLEWQHAVSEKTYTWNDAVSYCENLEYAGYADWRLPEPLEILTIVDHGAYDYAQDAFDDEPQMLVNKLYFRSIFPSFAAGNNLWTSKLYADDTEKAWVFSPQRSYVFPHPSKADIYNAICVRGGILPRAEFEKPETGGNEVVTDLSTGRMWQKGFTKMENEKLSNAEAYCEDLTCAGFSDWRLPNKNELASLTGFDNNESFSDFFDMPENGEFISSTKFILNAEYMGEPYAMVDEKVITINLKGELGYAEINSGTFNVRCVRNIE